MSDDKRPVEHPNTAPVEFMKNGTTRFVMEGRVIRLRRPKVGEFRTLREALDETNDEIRRATQELMDLQSTLNAETESIAGGETQMASLDPESRQQIRDIQHRAEVEGRQFRRFQETTRFGWFALVLETLSSDSLGKIIDRAEGEAEEATRLPGEEAEPWMWDPEFIRQLVLHWQTVPLAHGER